MTTDTLNLNMNRFAVSVDRDKYSTADAVEEYRRTCDEAAVIVGYLRGEGRARYGYTTSRVDDKTILDTLDSYFEGDTTDVKVIDGPFPQPTDESYYYWLECNAPDDFDIAFEAAVETIEECRSDFGVDEMTDDEKDALLREVVVDCASYGEYGAFVEGYYGWYRVAICG